MNLKEYSNCLPDFSRLWESRIVASLRFRLRTMMFAIAVAAVLMLLVRIRAQMNAFFNPVPLFDLSVFAGAAIGVVVGFALVCIRYWARRMAQIQEKDEPSNCDRDPGPRHAVEPGARGRLAVAAQSDVV